MSRFPFFAVVRFVDSLVDVSLQLVVGLLHLPDSLSAFASRLIGIRNAEI